MRSESDGVFGAWSNATPIAVNFTLTPSVTDALSTSNNMAIILGVSIPIAIIAAIVLALIVFLVVYICYRQFKLRRSLKVSAVMVISIQQK